MLKLESEKTKTAAEAADYDAQLRVTKEAEVLGNNTPASAEREQARRVAARTALVQARLLCVSTSMLKREASQSTHEIESAITEVDTVEGKLATSKSPVPLRDAIGARSRCQTLLTETRRAALSTNPTTPATDELFVELAQSGFSPSRDDRGIVVTFSKPFEGDRMNAQVSSKFDLLVTIAKQHHTTSLLVVSHSTQGEPNTMDLRRTDRATAKLRDAGLSQVQGLAAGGRLPIAQNGDLGAAGRNERIEVVYVTRQ